ncbi:amyloid beta A4 precursor protein-binding family B member 1-interacting protein isoform X2 [Spea bombifrons]|uniref:amyloid beta A4 precursor protein-binding family B member 1-interacting protein isoform X2 n=1 Tax=Spea bombifrons TaxID=233779 RepID=UPI00234B58D0|nr:amyloid beta A4 precursor protein-binding family B member 1-interacting protein isoform X2 [Spea bombifrons]
MEQTCDEIEEMFANLLGEMDLLTQSLGIETIPPPAHNQTTEMNFSFGFKDLNESLNALEDNDFDALMADLVADIGEAEEKVTFKTQESSSDATCFLDHQPYFPANVPVGSTEDNLPPPPSLFPPPPPPPEFEVGLPPPPPDPTEPTKQEIQESKEKADKIKLALGKMKEAKVKKLIIKVHMNDNSTKTLMVDERQTVRDILDNLFEKTHCDCTVEWCLYEIISELQMERFFEDHENIVDILSDWTRDTENKIHFLQKNEKYAVFKNPQNFFLARKGSSDMKDMNEKSKLSLLEQSFCGSSVIVPELEGALYLKEDGKKSWKKRYFLLRASGIYYVPKGKTKTSRDLACFIQFANVNIYYGIQYKAKYKAPTDHCFVLKHPQIQKESQYIKYLCCDDPWILHQWVTGIRIAKYGKVLYDNYKTAVQRAGLASHWSALCSSSAPNTTDSSQGSSQTCQTATTVSSSFSDAWKRAESAQDNRPTETKRSEPKISPPKPKQPPPPPIRGQPNTHIATTPPLPIKMNSTIPPPPQFQAPEPLKMEEDFLPPPPPEFLDSPPDFLPPPPPAFSGQAEFPPPPQFSEPPSTNFVILPPPPPTPTTIKPQLPAKKQPPNPPKRQTNPGIPAAASHQNGAADGEGDFMSDLMKALQKKKGNVS